MLRVLLFVPLVVYLLLGVVLVVRQSMGYDPDTLRILTSGAASFALYYYVCVAILSAFRLSLPRFALGGLAGPVALFLILAAIAVPLGLMLAKSLLVCGSNGGADEPANYAGGVVGSCLFYGNR